MLVRDLPVASETIPPLALDLPEPASDTMLSFALAVASQIHDQTLKEQLSDGLVASLDPDAPPQDASLPQIVASICASIEAMTHARAATREALERSMTSVHATRTLLRSLAQIS